MSELLDAALSYCRMGLSVIPLQPKGKSPIMDWTEYSTRRATEAEIESWWNKNPRANVGIITGKISNIVAVDIDIHRGGKPEEVFDIAPTGLISKTGRGGFHLLYSYDDSLSRNIVGKDGIDVRSNGGLIVAPPSIHENGNEYKWVKYENIGKVTFLLSKRFEKIVDESYEHGEKWLTDALSGVGSGSRNDTCAKIAGYYAGKGIPRDVATVMLLNWNMTNNPPLSNGEIITTVTSVYKTSYRHTPPVTQNQPAEENKFKVVGMQEYMATYGANAVTWVIPDWLPEQTIGFAISPPGTYKTWMLLDLAVSVATGTDFLGQFPVERAGPVLLIQQEDHHGGLTERIATIINARYNLIPEEDGDMDNFEIMIPPEIPIYWHPDRKLRFNDKAVMDELEKQVAEIRPKLVIIDPLYSAAETDDYMAKSASEMFRLKEMRDKYKCTFIIAHHKKKKAEGNEREGLWGSQFLNAFLETGWQIRNTGEAVVSILRHFKVKKASSEIILKFNIETDNSPYKYDVEITEGMDDEESSIVLLLEEKGPMNIKQISDETKIGRSTISRRVKLLIADKVLVKNADGTYQPTSTLEM